MKQKNENKKCGFRIGSLDLNELFYSQILIGTELEVLTILTLIAILKNLFPRDFLQEIHAKWLWYSPHTDYILYVLYILYRPYDIAHIVAQITSQYNMGSRYCMVLRGINALSDHIPAHFHQFYHVMSW